MKSLVEIKQSEIETKRLQASIETTINSSQLETLRKQLKQLNFDQDTAVMNYLETNDSSYNTMTQENFDLLINDQIEFIVTKEESSFFKSHAIKLNGEIHNNGFFYANCYETDFALLDFQKGFYPLGYEGLVNYFGEADLTITKKGYKIFGSRVPQKYIGSIDSDGNIRMETTDSYWEIDGSNYVNKLIADFFSGYADKRTKFLDNKDKIKKSIRDFRLNLS